MRRLQRRIGTLLVIAGAGVLVWALVVWAWQDPITGLYTRWKQHQLAQRYDRLYTSYRPLHNTRTTTAGALHALRVEARTYRKQARRGDPIGRITIPRMGVRMVLVNGTDHDSLTKGPGRDLRSFMPGEGELIYVAGHRTTYLAPFSHIESLRTGDRVTLSMPYAMLDYAVTGHRIVGASDLSVLQTHHREQLELQACHPRFFASHRYIAYAKLVAVHMRGVGGRLSPTALAAAAQS